MENDYEYADEWAKICEAALEEEKHITQLKEQYRLELKAQLNVSRVWEWLDGMLDGWQPIGIFNATIENKCIFGFAKPKPHAIIQDEKYKHLALWNQGEDKKEAGVNHIFICQYTQGEDCYSGYIAIPLKNHKYFLISFNC